MSPGVNDGILQRYFNTSVNLRAGESLSGFINILADISCNTRQSRAVWRRMSASVACLNSNAT